MSSFWFSKDNTKSLFTPWKLGIIKWFKYLFWINVFIFDSYLFQLIVLLKPDFNYWSNFALSCVDKVTTRAYSFVSVILHFVCPFAEEITQVGDHVKVKLTSQLISGISRVLQKLLKYFNGTIISTSFVLPVAGAFPVIFILNLNDSDCVMLLFGLSL